MQPGRVFRRTVVARCAAVLLLAAAVASPARAQQNRIDVVTPLAPELTAYGPHDIGVRTIQAVDRNRPDLLRAKEGAAVPRYDRAFTLEVWYPAAPGQPPGGEYRTTTRDPAVSIVLHGRAVRDAAPSRAGTPFPLVIVSHGYPGNRFLMSHLCENLASKGYVVVSIDHPDSTYGDQALFASTLYNRPLDQLFVLDEIARLSRSEGSFLYGLVDAGRAGLVGYSMGGYGAVNAAGGGFSAAAAGMQGAPPNGMLAERGSGSAAMRKGTDPRIRAVIAIGPWGMQRGLWDAEGLANIRTAMLFVAGSADEISGYEKGTRALFEGTVNADRYLLTFLDAGHNAGAPIPAPAESFQYSAALKTFPFMHYADPVWDTTRMNNILDHFATAFFGWHLRGDASMRDYLTAAPGGAGQKPGDPPAGLKGFKPGTDRGVRVEGKRD